MKRKSGVTRPFLANAQKAEEKRRQLTIRQRTGAAHVFKNTGAVAIMQDMVYSATAPMMMGVPSFAWFRKPQYQFDIVKDWQIRVDIPMLMMYPNTHRMNKETRSKIPANVINSDGTLNSRFRRVMESFRVK